MGAHTLWSSVGLLILRLGVGAYLMTHGWQKVQWVLDGEFGRLDNPIRLGEAPSLVLAAFAEFLCALLVLAGLATRLAAVPVVITMLVAAFVAHADDPWTLTASAGGPSKELALIFGTVFTALIFTGAGRFSLDAMLMRTRFSGWWNR